MFNDVWDKGASKVMQEGKELRFLPGNVLRKQSSVYSSSSCKYCEASKRCIPARNDASNIYRINKGRKCQGGCIRF